MLLHRFRGVTGAELGPLCPTQVTEETAAITQISLSHSNYLTGLPDTPLPALQGAGSQTAHKGARLFSP